jgi:hypothetical protein
LLAVDELLQGMQELAINQGVEELAINQGMEDLAIDELRQRMEVGRRPS